MTTARALSMPCAYIRTYIYIHVYIYPTMTGHAQLSSCAVVAAATAAAVVMAGSGESFWACQKALIRTRGLHAELLGSHF